MAFPAGRFQALSVVWDTRPAADGGQRWDHLYPDEAVDHRDPLHWTGVYQNWNQMCAECHSTNLEKGYDTEADNYRTSWSEINVSCQACHGPGSVHARWAAEIETGAASGDPADGLVVERVVVIRVFGKRLLQIRDDLCGAIGLDHLDDFQLDAFFEVVARLFRFLETILGAELGGKRVVLIHHGHGVGRELLAPPAPNGAPLGR